MNAASRNWYAPRREGRGREAPVDPDAGSAASTTTIDFPGSMSILEWELSDGHGFEREPSEAIEDGNVVKEV